MGSAASSEGGTPRSGASGEPDRGAVVRAFYDLVRSEPERALGLLADTLAAGERGSLLSAWRSLTDVLVERVEPRDDGTVLVVVRMTPAHGTPLRVTQLLGLDEGPQSRISRARLLSVRAVS